MEYELECSAEFDGAMGAVVAPSRMSIDAFVLPSIAVRGSDCLRPAVLTWCETSMERPSDPALRALSWRRLACAYH